MATILALAWVCGGMSRYPASASLVCPSCGDPHSEVTNSRARTGYIYRRRKCRACGAGYSTREFTVADLQARKDAEKVLRMVRTAFKDAFG